MIGHGEKLSRKQDQAITALATCPSITKAAVHCGLAEVTSAVGSSRMASRLPTGSPPCRGPARHRPGAACHWGSRRDPPQRYAEPRGPGQCACFCGKDHPRHGRQSGRARGSRSPDSRPRSARPSPYEPSEVCVAGSPGWKSSGGPGWWQTSCGVRGSASPASWARFSLAELLGRDQATVDAILEQLTEAEGAALDALIGPELFAFLETLSASELEAICRADRATMRRFVHAFQRWRNGRA